MRLEKILSFDGLRPITSGGIRDVGMLCSLRVGEWVWVHDGVIMKQQRVSNAPVLGVQKGKIIFLVASSVSSTGYYLVTVDLGAESAETEEIDLSAFSVWQHAYDGENYILDQDYTLTQIGVGAISLPVPVGAVYDYWGISVVDGKLYALLTDYNSNGTAGNTKSYQLNEIWSLSESTNLDTLVATQNTRAQDLCVTESEVATKWADATYPAVRPIVQNGSGPQESPAAYYLESLWDSDLQAYKTSLGDGEVVVSFQHYGFIDPGAAAYAVPLSNSLGNNGELICKTKLNGRALRVWDVLLGGVNYGHDGTPIQMLAATQAQENTIDGSSVCKVELTGTRNVSWSTGTAVYLLGTNLFSGALAQYNDGRPIYLTATYKKASCTYSGSNTITGDNTWAQDVNGGLIRDSFHAKASWSSPWYNRDSEEVGYTGPNANYQTPLYDAGGAIVYLDKSDGKIKFNGTELLVADSVFSHGDLKKE